MSRLISSVALLLLATLALPAVAAEAQLLVGPLLSLLLFLATVRLALRPRRRRS